MISKRDIVTNSDFIDQIVYVDGLPSRLKRGVANQNTLRKPYFKWWLAANLIEVPLRANRISDVPNPGLGG